MRRRRYEVTEMYALIDISNSITRSGDRQLSDRMAVWEVTPARHSGRPALRWKRVQPERLANVLKALLDPPGQDRDVG